MKRFLFGLSSVLLASALYFAPVAQAIQYWADELITDGSVDFKEQTSTPSSPSSGRWKMYIDDVGVLNQLDSSGVINPVTSVGFKNAIINGDFRVWQRGTSFNDPNGHYGPDRFIMFQGGGSNTVTFSRQSFTLGQTDVPGEPQYYLRWEKTAGTDGSPELRQRIESVRTFAGETVTTSFWARADSARDLNITFNQRFGSGGTPSSVVTTGAGTCTLTTSWTRCVGTATLPDLSGKTLGTNGDDTLEWRLNWSSNANGTIDIARVQVEKGSITTPFERRPIGVEVALAQRYFQKSFNLVTAPAQNAGDDENTSQWGSTVSGTNVNRSVTYSFPVPLRGSPTVTLYNPQAANAQCYNATRSSDGTSSGSQQTRRHIRFFCNGPSDTASGDLIRVHWTADAEL